MEVATEGKALHKTIGSKIWYFFNSLKLTIFVLITLAVVSIFGTVIEQNLPVETYLSAYGPKWTRVILTVRINDMYHTWWFMSLLALLALNIIVCTFERFPPKWRSLLNHKPSNGRFDPKLIDKCAHNHTVNVNADSGSARDRVLSALKKKRFSYVTSGEKGDFYVYAWKGRLGRLGSDVTHISLLLILLGAIVGSFAGFKDFKAVNVGETMSVPYHDFKLRLDKFWIEYYESGQIRQYNSLVTVLDGGKEAMQKQIWVNEPLSYKGVRFFQSSYGAAWNKVADATITLVDRKSGKPLSEPFTVKWEETKKIPGTGFAVKLVGYTADFAYDEKTNTVYSKSAEPENPAVNLEIYDAEKVVSTPWIFAKYPGIFPALPNSDKDLYFTNYKGIMYSGISLNQDPGTNIVWAGAIVMGIGFILAFFVFHRRLWIHIKDTGKSSEVKIGGIINKNSLVFERELGDIVEKITAD